MGDKSEIKHRRGRPRKEETFNRRLIFCGSEEHKYMLDTLTKDLNKSKGEIMRDAIKLLYDFENNKGD